MPNPAPGFEKRPQHTVEIAPAPGQLTVSFAGTELARSSAVLALAEASYPLVYYIPLADVDAAAIQPSDTSTYCPFKGHASYFHVSVNNESKLTDAIWTYRPPYDECLAIKDYVAFYTDKLTVAYEAT